MNGVLRWMNESLREMNGVLRWMNESLREINGVLRWMNESLIQYAWVILVFGDPPNPLKKGG